MLKRFWRFLFYSCDHHFELKSVDGGHIKFCTNCGESEVIYIKCNHCYTLQSRYELGKTDRHEGTNWFRWCEIHRCEKCGEVKEILI